MNQESRIKKGKFIVIEGGEGSGKTTIVKLIKETFPSLVVTREPGGSPFAEKIRSLILSSDAKDADANTQFGLFWAARADHVKNTIIPALQKGISVISDRFDSSSFAYQIYGQENQHLKKLFFQVRKIYLGNCIPDIYIFLDVDPKEGLKRRANEKGYDKNHFDERNLDFHIRIREGFLEFLKNVSHVVINANLSLEKVKAESLKKIKSILK